MPGVDFMSRLLRYNLFLLTLLFSIQPLQAQPYNAIFDKIEELCRSKILKNAQWSLYARYANTDEIIISFNSQQSLAPASGLKLITTSAALSILGENYKYKTIIYYDGEISSGGVLKGNIYINGSGDPTLGSDLVENSLSLEELMSSWTGAVKRKGIIKIDGNVIADDLLFDRIPIPDRWYWMDIGNYYGTSSSALCINDNLYKLYFKPGSKAGDEAEVSGEVGDGGGLDLKGQADLRRPVFALIVEQLSLIDEACLVFRQDALIAARL